MPIYLFLCTVHGYIFHPTFWYEKMSVFGSCANNSRFNVSRPVYTNIDFCVAPCRKTPHDQIRTDPIGVLHGLFAKKQLNLVAVYYAMPCDTPIGSVLVWSCGVAQHSMARFGCLCKQAVQHTHRIGSSVAKRHRATRRDKIFLFV
jgi:hypothetical protein